MEAFPGTEGAARKEDFFVWVIFRNVKLRIQRFTCPLQNNLESTVAQVRRFYIQTLTKSTSGAFNRFPGAVSPHPHFLHLPFFPLIKRAHFNLKDQLFTRAYGQIHLWKDYYQQLIADEQKTDAGGQNNRGSSVAARRICDVTMNS
ncbi:hypothetical protein JTE90_026271 [Oedothorax gibbosus]|uniref:Uncharacterized protein n=1 Tax=Oedothorax gibbosus TaxID=931172 RepID=A0AAV6U2Q2_9ARAC|nr:hypothetical protein JTE90_026271 [Oedothorax gibbosus]